MKSLFEMLQAIFGKNIISRTIGTRTNVIKLPTNKSSPLKNEFDVVRSAENPQVFEKLKKVIEDEAPYISRMNDAERLIYEGNVKRLHDYLVSIGEIKPTITAEVVGLTTKEPISGKGLESLVEEAGQTSPPGTLIGDIQSRINRLKNLAKEEGTTMQGVVEDFASGQKGMLKLRDEGLVRSTARQIMFNDIKSGKLKVSKEVQDIVSGRASGDPIDSFRTIYGEDALEQLDSLTPDLRQLRTEVEAEKLARSKFKFEPKLDRPKESYTPEEMEKILKEGEEEGSKGLDYLTGQEPPEKKATGGRVGFALGTTYKVLSKNLNDSVPIGLMLPADALPNETYVEYFLRKRAEQTPAITSISSSPPPVTTPVVRPEDEILMRYREYINTSKPSQSDLENKYRELSQGKADGGRIGFNIGGGKKILDLIAEMNKKLKDKKSMETVNPKTGEVTIPKEPITTAEKNYYSYNADKEFNKLMNKHKKAAAAHDQLDNIDIYDKIAPDQLGEVIAEMAGKNVDRLTDAQRREFYKKAQSYLTDFIKIDRTRKAVDKFNQGLELTATDRLYLKFAQPVDSLPTTKSINISDEATAKAFTDFARENDPEGFKKIQKIVDDINNENALKEFDIKDREPNAKGGSVGIGYLVGE